MKNFILIAIMAILGSFQTALAQVTVTATVKMVPSSVTFSNAQQGSATIQWKLDAKGAFPTACLYVFATNTLTANPNGPWSVSECESAHNNTYNRNVSYLQSLSGISYYYYGIAQQNFNANFTPLAYIKVTCTRDSPAAGVTTCTYL